MAIAMTMRGFNELDVRWPLFFFRWVIFSTDFLRFAKTWKKPIEYKFEYFAKRSIEFRSFDLFV